jgi:hypothetical protein
MSASRRKPPGKATAFQEVQEEGEPSTFQETPPVQRPDLIQDSQPIDSMPSQTLEPRAQLNQGLSNIIGASVQLTDSEVNSAKYRIRYFLNPTLHWIVYEFRALHGILYCTVSGQYRIEISYDTACKEPHGPVYPIVTRP